LVGHLHGCPGTFARAARLPRSVVAVPATIAPSLVDAARADLLASPDGARAVAAWSAHETSPFPLATRVVRHPGTDERWIVMHAERLGDGCHGDDPSFE